MACIELAYQSQRQSLSQLSPACHALSTVSRSVSAQSKLGVTGSTRPAHEPTIALPTPSPHVAAEVTRWQHSAHLPPHHLFAKEHPTASIARTHRTLLANQPPFSPLSSMSSPDPAAAPAGESAGDSSSPATSTPSSPTASSSASPVPPKSLELTLSGRSLDSLPFDLLASHASSIVKLDLSDNRLKDLSSLHSLPRLHTLLLDKNRLTSLASLPLLPSLTTLWLNNNALDNLPVTLSHLSTHCPALSYLSVLRNPFTPDAYASESEVESYHRFRLHTLWRLKGLRFLDAQAVTREEREEAEAKGEFCAVARPQADGDDDRKALRPEGVQRALIGVAAGNAGPVKVATFLAKGKPRYDGANSEGNRFIVNEDL